MDFNIRLRNGKILSGIIKSSGEDLKAVVILVHGLGEHIQRYNSWADLFTSENIGFAGVDLPGHGRSDGKRGHINPFSVTTEMLDILIKSCIQTFPGTPVYLYGHSFGGTIVLDYLLKKSPRIRGAIVTSPLLRLGFEPSKSKVKLASVLKYLIPALVQPSGLIQDHLSHDKKVVENYKNDPLVHDRISVSLFHGMMSSARYCLEHASELKVPALLIHGGDDLICSPEGSREFASKSPKVNFRIWDGGYHELHNETFREEVFKYIVSWIKS